MNVGNIRKDLFREKFFNAPIATTKGSAMKQMELDLGLQPIQRWLHVWDDAKRAKEKALADKAQGEAGKPGRREEADKAACERIRVKR